MFSPSPPVNMNVLPNVLQRGLGTIKTSEQELSIWWWDASAAQVSA